MTSTFQCEYCQCFTFKRCDKSKQKCTSHGGKNSAHYFGKISITFFLNVINGHYDIGISNKLIFCKDRNTGYNLRKNDTQDLVPNFSRTDGFKYSFFLTVL